MNRPVFPSIFIYSFSYNTKSVQHIIWSLLFKFFNLWSGFYPLLSLYRFHCMTQFLYLCLFLLLIFSMYPSLVTLAHQYLNILKPNQTKAIRNSQKSLLITIFFNDQTFFFPSQEISWKSCLLFLLWFLSSTHSKSMEVSLLEGSLMQ